jgi:hypothetical protein
MVGANWYRTIVTTLVRHNFGVGFVQRSQNGGTAEDTAGLEQVMMTCLSCSVWTGQHETDEEYSYALCLLESIVDIEQLFVVASIGRAAR